jgi:hypothetical protein
MRSPTSPPRSSITYPPETIRRAQRALRCAPFELSLFQHMRLDSVSLLAIAGSSGVQLGYTRHPLSELATENELLWLIQVGLLRREVDGQGLTDCFRLTPLGRLVIDQAQDWNQTVNPQSPNPRSGSMWQDYALNLMSRWLRIPLL